MVVVVWATSGENRRADAMADADACADDTMDDAPYYPIDCCAQRRVSGIDNRGLGDFRAERKIIYKHPKTVSVVGLFRFSRVPSSSERLAFSHHIKRPYA